jgi:hypothetical protein
MGVLSIQPDGRTKQEVLTGPIATYRIISARLPDDLSSEDETPPMVTPDVASLCASLVDSIVNLCASAVTFEECGTATFRYPPAISGGSHTTTRYDSLSYHPASGENLLKEWFTRHTERSKYDLAEDTYQATTEHPEHQPELVDEPAWQLARGSSVIPKAGDDRDTLVYLDYGWLDVENDCTILVNVVSFVPA